MMYWPRRAWAELRNEVFVLPSRTLVLLWVAALLALPFVYGDAYVLRILTMTCIFAIFAASWDLLAGYTGQVNFGHALFFGAGAYTSGLMSLKLGLSPWLTVWAGAAVAHAVRLPGGLPLPAAARLVSLARDARFPADRPRPAVRLPGFFRRRAWHLRAAAPDGDADRQLLRRRDLDAGDHFRPLAARRFQVRHRAARHSRRRSRGARFGDQYAALQDGGVRHCRGGRRLRRRACLLTICGWPDLRPWKWRCPSRW